MSGRLLVRHVEATVGPIEVRHFPLGDKREHGYGEVESMPEAVLARCVVTFWFGTRRRSKTLKAGFRWTDPLGWPRGRAVEPREINEARRWVVARVGAQAWEHGIPLEAADVHHIDRATGDITSTERVEIVNEYGATYEQMHGLHDT